MNEIIERIFDLIEEMAFESKHLESNITGSSKTLILHLIKILKYKDPLNYKKHIRDINLIILNIKFDKNRCKSKISYTKLYKWMFLDLVKSIDDINEMNNILNVHYSELPEILSNEQIFDYVKNIMYKIIQQITDNTFQNLEIILKDLNIFDEEQYNYTLKSSKKN